MLHILLISVTGVCAKDERKHSARQLHVQSPTQPFLVCDDTKNGCVGDCCMCDSTWDT